MYVSKESTSPMTSVSEPTAPLPEMISSVVVCPLAVEEICTELYAELRAEVIADSGSYIQYLEAAEEEKK